MATIESETLGFFGLSWPEKVSNNAKKFVLSGQGKQINTTLTNNIHQKYLYYLVNGFKRVRFNPGTGDIRFRTWDTDSIKTINAIRGALNIPLIYVDSVLRSLYELAISGTIPYDKLDPLQVKENEKVNVLFKKKFDKNKIFTSINLIAIAAISTAVAILFKKRI